MSDSSTSPLTKKSFKCKVCQKDFKSNSNLKEHVRVHTLEKPFKCLECEKAFSHRGNLNKHVQSMHKHEPLKCGKCGQIFKFPSALCRHKNRMKNPRKYKCSKCCDSFDTKYGLSNHLIRGHTKTVQTGTSLSVSTDLGHATEEESNSPENPILNLRLTPVGPPGKRHPAEEYQASKEASEEMEDIEEFPSTQDPNAVQTHSSTTRARRKQSSPGKASAALPITTSKRFLPRSGNYSSSTASPSKKLKLPMAPAPSIIVSMTKNSSPKSFQNEPVLEQSDDEEDGEDDGEQDCEDNAASNSSQQHEEDESADASFSGGHGVLKGNSPTNDTFKIPAIPTINMEEDVNCVQGTQLDTPADFTAANDLADEEEDLYVNDTLNPIKHWISNATKTNILQITMELNIVRIKIQEFIDVLTCKSKGLDAKLVMDIIVLIDLKLENERVAGLLLLDYLLGLNSNDLLELYMNKTTFSSTVTEIFKIAVKFILQKRLRSTFPNLDLWSTLPEDLVQELSLDFVIFPVHDEDIPEKAKQSQITVKEVQYMFQISRLLHQTVSSQLHKYSATQEDHQENVHAVLAGESLIDTFIDSIIKMEETTVYEILLFMHQQSKTGTTCFNIPTTDTGSLELHLHRSLLQLYGVNEQAIGNPGPATSQDVATFLNLLYQPFNPANVKGKITIGVLNIAKSFGIVEMWNFLFRDQFSRSLFTTTNNTSLLPILFHVGKDNEIKDVLNNLASIFPGETIFDALYGLTSDEVCNVGKELKIDNVDKFKLLLQWSFGAANQQCEDLTKPMYYENVKKEFSKVLNALPLEKMANHYPFLLKTKYISPSDIQSSRKCFTMQH